MHKIFSLKEIFIPKASINVTIKPLNSPAIMSFEKSEKDALKGLQVEKQSESQYTESLTPEWIKTNCAYGGYQFPKDVQIPASSNWSESRETFRYIKYYENTFENVPIENLPSDYNPETVFENGKSIGLGLEDVHTKHKGENCSVAVIDGVLNENHREIQVKEQNFMQGTNKNSEGWFHASACAGILAGKEHGIVPEAELYHYAVNPESRQSQNQGQVEALKSILKHNKQYPNNKIIVVSVSATLPNNQETRLLLQEMRDSGTWVLDAREFRENFGYLEKKDPMVDTEDYNNYQIYNYFDNNKKPNTNALFVNSGDRTVPAPEKSPTSYRHDSQASQSWAIPVVAGYYTLACQADPTMTPEKFIELAHKTARHIQSTTPVLSGNFSNPTIERSHNTIDIQIIDIKALINEIKTSSE